MDHVAGPITDEQRPLDADPLDGIQSSDHVGGLHPLLRGETDPHHLLLQPPDGVIDLEPRFLQCHHHLLETKHRLDAGAEVEEVKHAVFDLGINETLSSESVVEDLRQSRQRVLADANDGDG